MSHFIQGQDIAEHIRLISINRANAKNALTTEMYTQLKHELLQAEASPSIRAIILYGNAECFTAGNDIGDFIENPPTDEKQRSFQSVQNPESAANPIAGSR